jgi:hypothetical protein
MTKADRMAIFLKANLKSKPDGVVLGLKELEILENNPSPRTDPDYKDHNDFYEDQPTFCGIPVIRSYEESCFALTFNIKIK